MEALRRHLGIDRWLLYGGSWASTLILAYAQRHPDLAQLQAVGQPRAADDVADRVGQRRDVADGLGDRPDTPLVEREPVEQPLRHPARAPPLEVLRVRRDDRLDRRVERVGDGPQRGVLRGARQLGVADAYLGLAAGLDQTQLCLQFFLAHAGNLRLRRTCLDGFAVSREDFFFGCVLKLGSSRCIDRRDRGNHLLRRLGSALLLQARVVIGGHVAQRSHLLPAQTGGAAAPAAG